MASRISQAAFSTNGTAKAAPKKKARPVTVKAHTQRMRRYGAMFTGGVGVGMLGLSVYHCTEAIQALSPSYIPLSALLAIGIDAGMVASEAAELLAPHDVNVVSWARRYMAASVALSMALNAYANVTHAHSSTQSIMGGALGVIVPGLVFVLFKVAGYLAKAK